MHSARRPENPAGFTLMELMVSIALVLIIILGVNTVFRITSDTVNGGMALASASRDQRAATAVLSADLHNAALEQGPCLIVRSERIGAFRNRADEQADRDATAVSGVLTVDLNGNNQEGETNAPGERVSVATLNNRNHRVDRLMFFRTGLFRRQTGSGGTYVDDETSTEAYVWIGHVRQPNNRSVNTAQTGGTNAAYYNPGAPDSDSTTAGDRNDNNRYATQWILGRSVTLLRETPLGTFPPTQNNYFDDVPISTTLNLSPLSPGTMSRAPNPQRFSWSRYDVAQTSISQFRNKVSLYASIHETNPPSDPRMYWWNLLSDERFVAFPYPDRPMTPYGVARTVPVFLPGCTQFAVEYAGDYLKQNPETGVIEGTYLQGPSGVDGVVDFIVVPTDHPEYVNAPYVGSYKTDYRTRRVRWYGMPRNVDTSDDRVGVPMVRGQGPDPDRYLDVVPLRDILATVSDPAMLGGRDVETDRNFFERNTYRGETGYLPPAANYAATMPPDQKFVLAWGPSDLVKGSLTKPKMLRFTLAVDDPNGRLTEGQTFEYVVDLP